MSNRFVESITHSICLLLLRVGFGSLMFYLHGLPKLQNYEQKKDGFLDPLGIGNEYSLMLAIFGEIVCSVLLAIGLCSRLAALGLVSTMGVALYFHSNQPFEKSEPALLYLIPFVCILIAGPGKLSFDRLLWGLFFKRDNKK